ncbi:DNA repair protein RecN [Anoxynatronum buryatiense]|uniref:DNA repair protein RecN n=1 Tax=Anoxynatronum buryatiense TaxID=489973 RepID=A0AA45WUJ8_9CLOT|nr:DNA repair protein RecN [Anoxynatronum buryatiense]SMP48417.1 DNA replication and repair protein RecN [Anoxynatronum buryatiense]
MLLELKINDFALIDDLQLSFSPGLTVLSGETGAGKSIVVDAVSMCLGGRADRDLVKSGAAKAHIQSVFEVDWQPEATHARLLQEAGVVGEDIHQLIVSREIHATGRSVSRINGIIVTQQLLRQVMQHVADLHGQHEHQSLLQQESHLSLLDSFGGDTLQEIKEEYLQCYQALCRLRQNLHQLGSSETERARELDFVSFQIQEIEEAQLQPDEEEMLNKKNDLLRHAQQITTALGTFHEEIYEGSMGSTVLDTLSKNTKALWTVSGYSPELGDFASQAEELQIRLQDLSQELKRYLESIEFDPEEITRIQVRLDLIHNLKRKYGASVVDILAFQKQLQQKYESLINSETYYQKIMADLSEHQGKTLELAQKLSRQRKIIASKLEEEMIAVLHDLKMGKTIFKIAHTISESSSLDENGIDVVAFLISTNPGEPVKPLSKIASGGEMSRIMLAFKTIFARIDAIPTLIFDEIDAGISGRAAQVVGEKMSFVAGHHQVICITHLPQIAALADHHLYIEKQVMDERTQVHVRYLSEEERLYELGRLMDGNISEITLTHAREMRQKATQVTKKQQRS